MCDTISGVRARQEKVPFAMLDDPDMVRSDVSPLLGQQVALTVTSDQVTLTTPTEAQLAAEAVAAGQQAQENKEKILASGFSTEAGGAVSKVTAPRMMSLLDCMPSLAGAKASACARLEQVNGGCRSSPVPAVGGQGVGSSIVTDHAACTNGSRLGDQRHALLLQDRVVIVLMCGCAFLLLHVQVSLESKGAESFQTARGCCVPFGVMEWTISQLPDQQQQRFRQLLEESETAPVEALNDISEQLQVRLGSASCMTASMLQIAMPVPGCNSGLMLECQLLQLVCVSVAVQGWLVSL